MNTLTRLTTALLLAIVGGCSTISTLPSPASYYDAALVENDTTSGSLFGTASGQLSDEQIERILAHRWVPRPQSRIALLPAGWTRFGRWSEEMTLATQAIDSGTVRVLRASPTIYDASFLPSILIPGERTVPHLREAAARYQADLLLVYKTACHSFERYRLFAPNETRAYCSVEAVLLDVRSGLVPFTATSMQTFDAVKTDAELNTREAILKAQLEAIGAGMGDIATRLVTFVEAAQ